jgi:Plavaka transposase
MELPKGATIAPVIIASDKTQLSQFGGDKAAYPVYLSVGNVAKRVRREPSKRATVLLGYLPISTLQCFPEGDRKLEQYRLFHYAMHQLLSPLIQASREGVRMTCADGHIRAVYPILFAYVADHPEQCLVTCCKTNRCPKCTVDYKLHGEFFSDRNQPPLRNVTQVKRDLLAHFQGRANPTFDENGLNLVYTPFWVDLPYCNIFSCITPNLLHQMHKGVFKFHVMQWCVNIAGAEEVDRRCCLVPDQVGLCHFKKGISKISQWTGTEAKHVESIFIGLIAGAVDTDIVKVARAFLDFVYYASYTSHTTQTLEYMAATLREFHALKECFVKHGQRQDFNFPKFHSMQHYVSLIITHGSLDGYTMELPERLHIDLAKAGYRASNKRQYFQQMVKWLHRQEAVAAFTAYLEWVMPNYRAADSDLMFPANPTTATQPLNPSHPSPPLLLPIPLHCLAKHSPFPRTPVTVLWDTHGAVDFVSALEAFMAVHVRGQRLQPNSADVFDIFKQFTMNHNPLNGFDTNTVKETLRATPSRPSSRPGQAASPSHYDTVLVDMDGHAGAVGMQGVHCMTFPCSHLLNLLIPHHEPGIVVAQLRVIFRIPTYLADYPSPLAYVELFTGTQVLATNVRMYQVHRAHNRDNRRKAVVIRLDRIRSGCMLFPKFGRQIPLTWTRENVLEECGTFYINHYRDMHSFQTLSQPL